MEMDSFGNKLPGTTHEPSRDWDAIAKQAAEKIEETIEAHPDQPEINPRTKIVDTLSEALKTTVTSKLNPMGRFFTIGEDSEYLYDRYERRRVDWKSLAIMIASMHDDDYACDYWRGYYNYVHAVHVNEVLKVDVDAPVPDRTYPKDVESYLRFDPRHTMFNLVYDPTRPEGPVGYAPDDESELHKFRRYNIFWTPTILAEDTAEGRIWEHHLRTAIPNPEDQEIVLHWMARAVRQHGHLIGWMLGFYSRTGGTGKSSLIDPIFDILGRHNCYTISNIQSELNWTPFINKVLVELVEVENSDTLNNKLKSYITDKFIESQIKYNMGEQIKNCSNFIFTTNNLSSMQVGESDRRLCPIQFREEPMLAYASGIKAVNLFELSNRNPAVRSRLLSGIMHVLSQVSLKKMIKSAPVTELKKMIISDFNRTNFRFDADVILENFGVDPDGHMHLDQIAEVLHVNPSQLPGMRTIANTIKNAFPHAIELSGKCKVRDCQREKMFFKLRLYEE